jgi:hypothetical protein
MSDAATQTLKSEQVSGAVNLTTSPKGGRVSRAEQRIDRLKRCIGMLAGHADELCRAMSDDFGICRLAVWALQALRDMLRNRLKD